MIFEPLWESAQRGELLLVDGGMCHWHLRRDGQLTIREIIVLPNRQGDGIGRAMVERLARTPGAMCLFAKCPADLDANFFYEAVGFSYEGDERTQSGRNIKKWRLEL